MGLTLDAMQAGSFSHKWVALIEGCKYVLSDAPQAAVQAALAGTDWASAPVISGLFVDCKLKQSINPWNPLSNNASKCTLRVHDPDDSFGKFVHKRAAGAETQLSVTAGRGDATLTVNSTTGFSGSGEIFIGTECIGYTGTTATTFTTCTRGKYSPFGTEPTGSGATRFGNRHRIALDTNHVQLDPIVTQNPRHWIGKRVGVWLHTWDGTSLNTKANAQLVFAGRIGAINDDPNTFHTVIDLDHAAKEIEGSIMGREMWSGTLRSGLNLVTGRKFRMLDSTSTASKQANDLVVVASGASGTNQMNAGVYGLDELVGIINSWLAGELAATRIYGYYHWESPVTTDDGLRTRCSWYISTASQEPCLWQMTVPAEVDAFLGLNKETPSDGGASGGAAHGLTSNRANTFVGKYCPMTQLVFKPSGPAKIGQEFSESLVYSVDNESGSFIDQRALFPASIKAGTISSGNWGLFLLDDKVLLVAQYAFGSIAKAWLAPFQLIADNSGEAVSYIGRRADDKQTGPITIRQVFVLEASLTTLLLQLIYSTGSSAYNHATYDTLGYGLGLDMPGQLFGPEFERSVNNLPGSDVALQVVIDEPIRFAELFSADMIIRRAFVRWKDQHFEVHQWRTPMPELAVATLSDANKAAPSGQVVNHRSAMTETDEHVRPIVKIDFGRDFASGKNEQYLKSVQIEDQTAVDDAGGNVKPITIKMRNTYSSLANSGPGLERLLPDFVAFAPMITRPWKVFSRSIDQRLFEGYAPGDVVNVTDTYARDPLTGARGITGRAMTIIGHSYDLGGPSPDGHAARPAGGEVTVSSLDYHRGGVYGPSADIDDTASAGGFDHGYNSGTSTIRCYAQRYSHSVTFSTGRGAVVTLIDAHDATNFVAGDKILICERDPANTASPVSWERTVLSQNADDIVLTSALSSPAWDNTKKYVITYQKYSQVQASQQGKTFQSLATAEMIESTEVPDHYSATVETNDYLPNGSTKAAFIADLHIADGRSASTYLHKELRRLVDNFIDYKSAHSAPFLSENASQAGLAVDPWSILWAGPVFFGTEHLTSTVKRTLTVAPFWRSNGGGLPSKLRITLVRSRPTIATGQNPSPGSAYYDTRWDSDVYATSAEYSTSSTTWTTDADRTFDLSGIKDTEGMLWLIMEGQGSAQCRGPAKWIEGIRTVT